MSAEQLHSADDRLIYMANQIARNLASEGDAAPTLTAQHIRDFWDPYMRQRLLALTVDDSSALSPIATKALAMLASD